MHIRLTMIMRLGTIYHDIDDDWIWSMAQVWNWAFVVHNCGIYDTRSTYLRYEHICRGNVQFDFCRVRTGSVREACLRSFSVKTASNRLSMNIKAPREP